MKQANEKSRDKRRPRSTGGIRIKLALQGGGAHGAFTWGVLDRLLDETDIDITAISGASAGALNGAAVASGLAAGGRAGGKRQLEQLWQKVSESGSLMTLLHLPLRKPGFGVWDDALPLLSPYQTNPIALELLRYVLGSVVDVELLRSPEAPRLFVNAVNVNTAVSRVFGPSDMSISALLASACAPLTFPAVEIDGQSYWDGSYSSNPMLWPLYDGESDVDILLVELTPRQRTETPTTAKNILNRINEIASVQGLLSELRQIDRLNRSTAGSGIIRFHLLSFPDMASDAEIEPSTKRTVGPLQFESLRGQGFAACASWLEVHRAALGQRSSVDIGAHYLSSVESRLGQPAQQPVEPQRRRSPAARRS